MADFYSSEDRTYTKDFERLINSSNQIGIVQGLEVTASGSFTLAVSKGRALFENTFVAIGASNVVVTAPDPALDRKDLVYVTSAGTVTIDAGIAASIPKPPNIGGPKRTMLAEIYVTAGTAGIVDSYITDERVMVYGNKYQDVYEGAVKDTGVCQIFDDNDEPLEDDWTEEFNPMKQWGG